MSLSLVLAVAVSSPTTAVGCSLFADLGGLSRDEIVVVAEAGAADDAVPGSSRDGGAEAPAQVPADGGETSPPAPSGCAKDPGATFCVDFEGPDPLGPTVWTSADVDAPGGAITLVDGSPVSAPRAALVVAPPTGCAFMNLYRELPGTFSRFRVRVSVKPESPEVVPIALFAEATPTRTYQVVVGLGTALWAQIQRNDNGAIADVAYENTSLGASTVGTWSEITIDWTTAARQVRVARGSSEVVLPLPADAVLVTPAGAFGAWCTESGARVMLDDIVMTAD